MAEAPVLEDTERTTGRVALRKNIAAAMALSVQYAAPLVRRIGQAPARR